MRMLLALGWRNIWRNRRRSLLTITAIASSTLLTVAFEGLTIGTWEYSVASSVEMFSGYLQIQQKGFQESPSLSKNFRYPGQVSECVRNVPGVTGYAPRIQADGLISFHGNSSGTAVIGIDPEAEAQVSRFQDRVKRGRMLRQDRTDEVVVGEGLRKNLQAEIGDTVVFLAQGYDGALGNQKFCIVGTMKFGSPEVDATMALVHYRAAQELLAMDGFVNVLAIGTTGLQAVGTVHDGIQSSLLSHGLEKLAVLPWSEVMPELKQGMDLDKINHSLFMGILVIVVAFGIMNTILMSVTERFREFGVTLALGMRSRDLVRLVLLETACMASVGCAIGCLAGYGVNVLLHAHPILLVGSVAQIYEDYGFLPMITSTTRLSIPLVSTGLIFLLCCTASLYPLLRVARLEPLKGIRHT